MKDWKIIHRARFRLEADQWKQSLALVRMNPLRLRALYKRFPSSWIEILSLLWTLALATANTMLPQIEIMTKLQCTMGNHSMGADGSRNVSKHVTDCLMSSMSACERETSKEKWHITDKVTNKLPSLLNVSISILKIHEVRIFSTERYSSRNQGARITLYWAEC